MRANLYQRDLRQIQRNAHRILEQCAHYERHAAHGGDDTMRFGLILELAISTDRAARRAYKRVYREHGWAWPWRR